MSAVAWKVMSTGTRIASRKLAMKMTDTGWKAATGSKAPQDSYESERSHTEATVYAVLSAALLAGVATLAERKIADYYTRSTGRLAPPAQKAMDKREKELAKDRKI